jgi:hypothetical protein
MRLKNSRINWDFALFWPTALLLTAWLYYLLAAHVIIWFLQSDLELV